ncbi:MAG: DUF4982 domain-containing protein [Oscillospiraceae bacterium]|nr:DUF4982 domain-containing protein [Oscillospiraceae bacterium]
MAEKRLFCDGWEFAKNPVNTEYSDELEFEAVDIPHDWLIYDVNNLYESSTGWYRKKFDYTKTENQRVALRFEGVYMDSKVYVNGVLAIEWKYGYSTFETDITRYLCDGENLITVRVDHIAPNSRWYSGAGIFRKVLLLTYNECHICSDGVYISADIDGNVNITAEVERPESANLSQLWLRHTVMDGKTALCSVERSCCGVDKSLVCELCINDGCAYSVNSDVLKVGSPTLWDIENPKLYTLKTELYRVDELLDSQTNTFGFRKIEFTNDKGFFLNNRHLKLNGCCEHHDLGALGAAFNKNAMLRKLEKLRSIGINSVRTSHNMPAKELMELADEMGFLIMSEGFDMWEMPKTENDYARFFREWVSKDVASWVRRDRNHPSLIGWSIGNEIYDTHAGERGQEITSLLKFLVRKYDFNRNGVVTIGSNFMVSDKARKCTDILKIAGYNYAERLYDEQHEKYPDWAIYGSETASTLQSRGIYHFPLSQSVLADSDEQCSALGNCTTGWGAKNSEYCIIADRDAKFSAGQYIWTGFDYIGEPTPYSTKNSYFGQFDTAGFEKDSAYIYKAEWTDYKTAPFVHIFPYWDFIDGQDIDVRVTTNAPYVKLFFNGNEVASKSIDHIAGKELTLDTVLKYEKGELCAIAFDENGAEIARNVKKSFGDAKKIKLTADREEINANGTDLIFVEISMLDENGVCVENANNRVFVNVKGAGRLVGLDNGDSTDYDQYKGTSRRLFSGKLLAIIAAKTECGDIELEVSSPSLESAYATFKANKCDVENGISANVENSCMPCECRDVENDIPVRKIAFESNGTHFDESCREIDFKVIVSPSNASYIDDIEYRVTTVLGIESNLAEITKVENGTVTVKCNGDGDFYLRALCKNGTPKYHIISALKLTSSGIGNATFNPYELVLGGLRTIESESITNGVDHGANFAGENSYFGFENVDFGKIGSDTISLPIFANMSTPVRIKVFDGTPENGELIGDFEYFKNPIWMTYQSEIYKLSKTLKGIHTISFQSSYSFNIQGFVFEKKEKEYACIMAVDNDKIYGDKFTVNDTDITGIGNNVMLEFGEFDFGQTPPRAIAITGKSNLECNSINLIVESESQKRVVIEFAKAEEYTERIFEIEPICGKAKISFVFLPGSDFDFESFRFVR